MKVLITGANGQVARDLIATAPPGMDIQAFSKSDLDITNAENLISIVSSSRPDIFINTAAYTAVDDCESNIDTAWAVNCDSLNNIVSAVNQTGARLLQYSTDYIFDGTSNIPYKPDDNPNPLSVYGNSKLAGEKIIKQKLKTGGLIIRTGWIYSAHGNNFVNTMLRLLESRDSINVVNDQVGTPTWSRSLAQASWQLLARNNGITTYHYSDSGSCNWYEFARVIKSYALGGKILSKAAEICPTTSEKYNAPAKRPKYSVLDCHETWNTLGYIPDDWKVALSKMIDLGKR